MKTSCKKNETPNSNSTMKLHSALILLLLFGLGCASSEPRSEKPVETEIVRVSDPIEEPYAIQIMVEEGAEGDYKLVVALKLRDGSHYVSPHSSDRFTGRFGISIEENDHLELDSSFVETPRSVEEFDPDPFVNGPVNWVRVNTSYQHQLKIKTGNDFEVEGLVRFVIEPRCTMEKVRFVIASQAGELKARLK